MRLSRSYSPVDAFQMVAVLSVDPAMKNSPSGDHARSYTCLFVTLDISFRCKCHSLKHLLWTPMLLVGKVLSGFPKVGNGAIGWHPEDDVTVCGSQYLPQSQVSSHAPSLADASIWPFGEKRATFTGAVCLERVARYSTRGGCGVTSWPVRAAWVEVDTVGMFGCTIHI